MRTRLLRAATAGRSLLELTQTKSRKQILIKGELIKREIQIKGLLRAPILTPPLTGPKDNTHIPVARPHANEIPRDHPV